MADLATLPHWVPSYRPYGLALCFSAWFWYLWSPGSWDKENTYNKVAIPGLRCPRLTPVSSLQLHYVHSTPGGSGSANPPVLSTVYAYVGTPPAQRQIASLVWRLGPTHFLEEVLPPSSVTTIYELGPNYVGSFQAIPSKQEVVIRMKPSGLLIEKLTVKASLPAYVSFLPLL